MVSQSPAKKQRRGVNRSSPIRRARRSRSDILELREEIVDWVALNRPVTVRQCFYAMVTRGAIDKTEREYKGTICRLLSDLRREGEIPYQWIADNTRWQRKPRTYSGVRELLESSQATYRRAVWDDQEAYVEIWLEKEALAGVLVEVTRKWDVPLMVTRGYPSLSFVHSAAQSIAAQDKPAHLYYFGDRDPSGVDIDRFVEQQIREIAPDVDLTFERVAVTPSQIHVHNLPTRPTKKTDSRAKSFKGESVEVDALPPDLLRSLCEECITEHIDLEQHERMLEVEKLERETLAQIAQSMGGSL